LSASLSPRRFRVGGRRISVAVDAEGAHLAGRLSP
jgi:hypothetical protein